MSIFPDQADFTTPAAALATATPGPNRSFSVSLVVPNDAPGTYQLFACQRCGDPDGFPAASFSFTIQPPSAPSLTVSPASGQPGQTITATGPGGTPQRVT